MLNATNHLGNTSQNHNEGAPHTHQDGQNQGDGQEHLHTRVPEGNDFGHALLKACYHDLHPGWGVMGGRRG